jgi:hypothetical protein
LTTDQLLRKLLSPIVPTIRHGVYSGNEEIYITYTYSRLGAAFGDNTAQAERQLIMLHLWCPDTFDETGLVEQIKSAIAGCEEFTYPDVADTSDITGKRYTFEFERLGGVHLKW